MKKGLSLLVLTITILVMIVLASVVIFISANVSNNSKKAAFASDLSQLEDLVLEYYLAEGSLPVVTTSTIYDKSTFTILITDGKDFLKNEISENGDDDAFFYKLDLGKLDIKSAKRGLEEDGDITDSYYVASNTFNVYYLQGEEIAGEYYFSLSENLTGKIKTANNQVLDKTDVTVSSITGAIKLTKNTAEFTNALTVDAKVVLETGETMKYFIAGQEITVASENTTIDVANIVSNNSNIKIAFYQSEANKYLLAQKYSGDAVVAEAKLNISNLDILAGDISSANIKYSKYNKFTLAKISGYTDLGGSGVKEARVLYTEKISGDAYYTNLPETITKEYVKQAGKKFDAAMLKLPSDVKKFALVLIDNAGNISEIAYDGLPFPEIGDIVEYKVEARSVTSSLATKTVSNKTDFVWRYIGINNNGELLIAPDITSDTPLVSRGLSVNWSDVPVEFDRLCKELYSVEGKGTARSMNLDDVNNLLGYIGEKGSYYPRYGDSGISYYVYTDSPKTVSEIASEINVSTSKFKGYIPYEMSDESIEVLHSNFYYILKDSHKNKMKYPEHRDYVFYGNSSSFPAYWLASYCVEANFREWRVKYYIRRVDYDSVCEDFYCDSDAKFSTGVSCALRPVVALQAQITKNSSGIWVLE